MSRVNGAVVTLPAEAAKIVLYRQRWLMLLLFCVLSALNGCMWIQFASVADLCRGYFGQSALAIDGFSMAYLITYIPGVFAANWVYDHRGLRAGLLLAAGLNAAGALLRWLGAVQAPPSFAMTMSGQLLAAMAQCLSFGAPPLLAVRFFGAGERATATTLGVLANQLGTGCGMLTATLVAEGSQLPPVLLATALAAFVILVLFAAAFRDAPPSPPSRSAAASAHAAEAGSEAEAEVASLLSADAKAVGVASSTGGSGYAAMMQNKGFVSLLLSYGAIMSAYNSASTLINVVLVPALGPDQAGTAASTIGFTLVAAGIPGGLLIGVLLGRSPRYHITFRLLIVAAALALAAYATAIQTEGVEILTLTLAAAAFGFASTALMSTGFEFAAELVWPVSAEKASALLNIANSAISTVVISGLQLVIDDDPERGYTYVGWVQVLFLLVGLVFACGCRAPLRRLEFERGAD